MIYYGMRTCWWTHDGNHLRELPSGIPCDPRGGVLMQTDDIEGFLKAAEDNPDYYGRNGLRTFMAAHHMNCRVAMRDFRHTSAETGGEYDAQLDYQALIEEKE